MTFLHFQCNSMRHGMKMIKQDIYSELKIRWNAQKHLNHHSSKVGEIAEWNDRYLLWHQFFYKTSRGKNHWLHIAWNATFYQILPILLTSPHKEPIMWKGPTWYFIIMTENMTKHFCRDRNLTWHKNMSWWWLPQGGVLRYSEIPRK